MAQPPPSTPDPDADIAELRAQGMERWEKLRTAVGHARSLQIRRPNHPMPLIGRFEGSGLRGKGGFGVVFEVFDPILERHLALKCCILSDDETCERLMKEAKIMAKFTHPNIVRVYETGWHGNDLFFVMEYVTGSTGLDFILRKSRPSWAEIIRVYQGAGAGLAAVHAQGIVHRDFKPSNILLDDDDWPRLTDFGLSYYDKGGDEVDDDDDADDADRGLGGTLSFMALEVLYGMVPTALSDQWSFCVALWMTFDRGLPFAGGTPEELCDAIMAGPVVHDPGVPEELRALARRGLDPDPRRRFADMKALLAELGRVLLLLEARAGGVEVPAPVILAPSPLPAPVRAVSRKWRQVAFVAASALAASFTVALVMPADSGEQTQTQKLRTETSPPEVPPQKLSMQAPPAQTPPTQTPPMQTPPMQTPPLQTPPAQTTTAYTTQCNTRSTSIVSISTELEAVCVTIRQGNLADAEINWRAVRARRYPVVGTEHYELAVMKIAAETKVVADTFEDQADKFSDVDKANVARQVAEGMAAWYLRDYQNLKPSQP